MLHGWIYFIIKSLFNDFNTSITLKVIVIAPLKFYVLLTANNAVKDFIKS